MVFKKLKRVVLMAFCGLAVFAPHQADAQNSRVYLAGYMGLNTMPDNDFSENTSGESGTYQTNNSVRFAGAIGVRLNRRVRFEPDLFKWRRNFEPRIILKWLLRL